MTRTASVILIAVLLGGCAKPGGPAGPGPGSAGQAPQTAGATGSGGAAGGAGGGPIGTGGASGGGVAAKSDAERLLAAFVPPAGAKRLSGMPSALDKIDWAVSTPGVGQLANVQGWWQVGGAPAAVLAAIKAAPPAGSAVQGGSSARANAIESLGVTFAWPDDGLLRDRQLQVSTAPLGADTVLRLDAFVAYADPKPVSAVIGPDAKVAVVSLIPRAAAGVTNDRAIDPPEPVTVTDPAKVAKVAAIINAAPPARPGLRRCPMMTATRTGMTIVFSVTAAGPKVATVHINTNGCEGITVTRAGASTGTDLAGGTGQINQIIDILGVRWPKQG